MKRSFVRMLSGLLAAAMVIGIPVAMPVKSNAYSMVHSIKVGDIEVKPVCNHVIGDTNTTLKQSNFVASTCVTGGYTEYTCWQCGQKVYQYYETMGHDYSKVKDIENSNSKEYTCSRCGHSFIALSSDVWGTTHSHENTGDTIKSSTFFAGCGFNAFGCTRYTCSLEGGCAYEQVKDYVAPLDHTYGDWSWEVKPTESTNGFAVRKCTGCGAVERMKTDILAAVTKVGRINTDMTFAYTTSSSQEVVAVLARGLTFNFANKMLNARYEATINGVTCYIDPQFVDEVRPDADKLYTGEPNVQKYIRVLTDCQVDVYSGKRTSFTVGTTQFLVDSAPLETLPNNTVKYVFRTESDVNGDTWGRISRTENRWIKLTGSNASKIICIPAYGFGDPLPDLKDVEVRKLADTGTVINTDIPVYNSKNTGAATVGTLPKGTKIKFYYQNVNGAAQTPFSTEGGASWGYIDEQTRGSLNLTASGYVLMDNVSLASNPKKENGSEKKEDGGVVATGTVVSSTNLRVRKEPMISVLNQIGSLPAGTKLEFYHIGDANGSRWGQINYKGQEGWVCMDYVVLQSGGIGADSGATGAAANGVVANCSTAVNVRDTNSTQGRLVSTIRLGTRVAITKLENGWGLVDGKGWVYMQYVNLDAGAEDAIKNPKKDTSNDVANGAITTYTNVKALGEVKTGREAYIYKDPIANDNSKLLTLVGGNTFTIVDRTIVKGTTWYKTTVGSVTGWVMENLFNIQLPDLTGSVSAGTLNVYQDANQESKVMTTLSQGSPVTIVEQTTDGVYVWGKVKLLNGWVQMNNLTLNVPSSNVVTGSSVGKTPITGKTNNAKTIVYKTANGSEQLMKLGANRVLTITDWYRVSTTELRGKFTDGDVTGWINMLDLDQDPVTAKVTVDVVNFYGDGNNAPSLNKVGDMNLRRNATTTVVERTLVGDVVWGRVAARDAANKFNYYWINLAGTDLGTYSLTPGTANTNNTTPTTPTTPGTPGTPGSAATAAAKGTIVNTEEVNVRSAAGVTNPKATTLKKGAVVTIYEQKTVDGALWGRCDQGWVAMAYVDLSTKTTTATGTVAGGTLSGNTILTTVPAGAIGVGFVNIKNLTVRNGAGLGYKQTGTLPLYTNVVIYEHILKDGMIWGRCDQGWICTSYVTYTGTSVTGSGTAGTIARCFYTANVRSTAGVGNALVAKIMVNSRVEILEQTTYSGETWGRTSLGWVNMQYVLADGTVPTP